jgi:arginine deiminase
VRTTLIDAAVDRARLDRRLAGELTTWLHGQCAGRLADALIGGVTVAEVPFGRDCLWGRIASGDAFLIAPLPNHLFTRDVSAWIGGRPYMGRMAHPVRRRESTHLLAVYQHHPCMDGAGPPLAVPSPLEGGDVLVLAPGRVMVGVGARTTAASVERLALALTECDPATELMVAVLPAQRATIHLDTVLTMVDRDTFTAYPEVAGSMPVFRVRRGRRSLRIDAEPDLRSALARALGVDAVQVVQTGGDHHVRDREQWDDANNVLAIAPGVVVAYDRNAATNERLSAAGIEVLTVPGAELGRGRGGPRCLSCPLQRSAVADGA